MVTSAIHSLLNPIDQSHFPIIILTKNFDIYKINSRALELYDWPSDETVMKNIFILCGQNTASLPLPHHISYPFKNQPFPLIWKSVIKKGAIKIIAHWEIRNVENKFLVLVAFNVGLYISDVAGIDYSIKNILCPLIKKIIIQSHLLNVSHQASRRLSKTIPGTLNDIIKLLPGQVYWTNSQGVYLGCNETVGELYGLASHRDLIGQTAYFIEQIMQTKFEKSLANSWETTNNRIMMTGEPLLLHHDPEFRSYSRVEKIIKPITNKVPLTNTYGERIGVFGITIDENDQAQLIQLLHVYRQLSHAEPTLTQDTRNIETLLTPRELECLSLTARGFTAKGIAKTLKLSRRTIETHSNNMRKKLQCYSKTRLAEIYWEYDSLKK